MEKTYMILFLVIIPEILAAFNPYTNYCALRTCRNPAAHTVCRYNRNGPGQGCAGHRVVANQLTPSEKAILLNRHNYVRQTVASGQQRGAGSYLLPRALNMQHLEWDEELASVAQVWANQCPTNYNPHDQCRDVARFKVGQNMVGIDSNDPNIGVLELVNYFYDEVRSFDVRVIPRYVYQIPVGHFVQMIWANTNKVGCGKITYVKPGAPASYLYSHILICNYGPKGINVGEPIYRTA